MAALIGDEVPTTGSELVEAEGPRSLHRWDGNLRNVTSMAVYTTTPAGGPSALRIVTATDRAPALDVFDASHGRLRSLGVPSKVASLLTYELPPQYRPGIAACYNNAVMYWDGESFDVLGILAAPLTVRKERLRCLATYTSLESRPRLVSGSSEGALQVFEVEPGAVLHAMEPMPFGIAAITVTATQGLAHMAVADSVGNLRIYDPEAGTVQHELGGFRRTITCMTFFQPSFGPMHALIAMASHMDTARVYDAVTGALVHSVGEKNGVLALAVYKEHDHSSGEDRDRLITAGDYPACKIWDGETGEALRTLKGHSAGVTALEVFEGTDGAPRLLSASMDGRWVCPESSSSTAVTLSTFDPGVRWSGCKMIDMQWQCSAVGPRGRNAIGCRKPGSGARSHSGGGLDRGSHLGHDRVGQWKLGSGGPGASTAADGSEIGAETRLS
jgi:WD40 repeat protein